MSRAAGQLGRVVWRGFSGVKTAGVRRKRNGFKLPTAAVSHQQETSVWY